MASTNDIWPYFGWIIYCLAASWGFPHKTFKVEIWWIILMIFLISHMILVCWKIIENNVSCVLTSMMYLRWNTRSYRKLPFMGAYFPKSSHVYSHMCNASNCIFNLLSSPHPCYYNFLFGANIVCMKWLYKPLLVCFKSYWPVLCKLQNILKNSLCLFVVQHFDCFCMFWRLFCNENVTIFSHNYSHSHVLPLALFKNSILDNHFLSMWAQISAHMWC